MTDRIPRNRSMELTHLEQFILVMLLAALMSIALAGMVFYRHVSLALQDAQIVFLAPPVKFEAK